MARTATPAQEEVFKDGYSQAQLDLMQNDVVSDAAQACYSHWYRRGYRFGLFHANRGLDNPEAAFAQTLNGNDADAS